VVCGTSEVVTFTSPLFDSTSITTRRFTERPSTVVLLAAGCASP
jgi:hypothetical protein